MVTTSVITASSGNASNTKVNVNSVAALLSALKTATPGQTIALAPGNYSGLAINGANFSTAVTITSQDSSHQAVLQGLKINNSSGLVLSNMDLTSVGSGDPYYAFRVNNDSNLTFSNLNVHGSLDNNPANDVSGFYVTSSSNITIQNSQFQQFQTAIAEMNNSHVTISGSSFHDLGADGIENAGSSYVTISSNAFTNFHPTDPVAVHPDAIQFWTTNTTASAHDITIANNVITRGNGDGTQVHGIFMRDETTKLPYQNVSISNNLVLGMQYNGISLDGVQKATLSNNTVMAYNDQPSWIRVLNSSNVTLSQNASSSYVFEGGNKNISETGDLKISAVTPGNSTLASLVLAASPLGASAISHTTSLTAALLQMKR